MTPNKTLLLLAPLAFTLGGCLSFGAKAPPTMFSLTAANPAPAGSSASGSQQSAIVVAEPETDRRLAVQRIPVQIDESNVAYVKDAAWVERPARLFRSLLAEYVRAKGGRLVIEDDQAEAASALRLTGRLLDMGYDARRRAAVVRYDAIRQTPGGAMTQRRFEAAVPVAAPEPAYIGPALNQAANQVAGQVAEWVG